MAVSPSIDRRLRVVLVSEFYPPYASDAAESAQRLADGIAHAGVELVVAACTVLGAPPMTVTASGNPRVYRVSCVAEAFVLLDLEEARRPFDVMHAIGVRMVVRCLHAPSRAARGTRPLVVSVGAGEDVEEERAARLLGRASWVVSASSELHERWMRRSGGQRSKSNGEPAASVIAPEDGEGYVALYARLANGECGGRADRGDRNDRGVRVAAELAQPMERA
jgi:hypothetical protein